MTGKDKLEIIADEACNYFDIPELELMTPSKERKYADVRNTVFYFALMFTDLNHDVIADYFSRKHVIVTHGKEAIKDLIQVNGFKKHTDELLKKIAARLHKEI